jgi:hypothetical protein
MACKWVPGPDVPHAEECERLAESATLPSNRHALLSAAETWRKMAADGADNGAGPGPEITTSLTARQ